MKKIVFGVILALAAGWVVNLVMAGNNIKENDSAQAATTAEVGEFPKGTIVPVKATTTKTNTKPAPEKTLKETTTPVKTTAPKTKGTTAKATAKTTTTKKTLSGMAWDASARKMISSMAQFDYSSKIRQSYINKVNAYAKRKGIKVITASVINNMHE